MSNHIISYHDMSHLVVSSLVLSCLVLSCRVVSCRVVSRRVASRRVASRRVATRRVALRYVVSRRVMSCHVTHVLSPSLSLTYDHTNIQSDTYVRTLININIRAYADGRTHVHLETYTGIYSCTFTYTITSKRTPVYYLAGTSRNGLASYAARTHRRRKTARVVGKPLP